MQLATLARIRHKYTDYDVLLRALEWKNARAIVEPVSLKKLVEWRGEMGNGGEEDNELEEIIRETIVLDDSDEDLDDAADDADAEETQDDHDSNTSFELVNETMAVDDIDAEESDAFRPVQRAGQHDAILQQHLRSKQERQDQRRQAIGKERLQAARRDVRTDRKERQAYPSALLIQLPLLTNDSDQVTAQVNVQANPRGEQPRIVVGNGREYMLPVSPVKSITGIQMVSYPYCGAV